MSHDPFSRTLRRVGPLGASMLPIYITAVLLVVTSLLLMLDLAALFDLLVTRGNPALDGQQSQLGRWLRGLHEQYTGAYSRQQCLLLLLGAALLLGGLLCAWRSLLERSARRLALWLAGQLRRDLYRQTFHLGGSDLIARGAAGPVELFTEGVRQVRVGLVARWMAIPYAPLLIAALLLLAAALQIWLALAGILLAGIVWLLASWLSASARQQNVLDADRASIHLGAMVEALKQARLVSGYLLEQKPGGSFAEALERFQKESLHGQLRGTVWRPLLLLCGIAAACVVAGLVGANLLFEPPRTTLFEVALLYAALAVMYFPLRQLARMRAAAARANAAAADIYAYLDREPGVGQPPDAVELPPFTQRLEFQNVTLRNAARETLLDGVSLTVPAKTHVAWYASNGSATVALAGLVARLYDPSSGRVALDGHDARDVSLESLRGQVALVLQEGLLFTGTVSENISCGDPRYGGEEIRDAARAAGIYDYIRQLPQDFVTIVGAQGVRVEPGEALLIGLARALLRDPAILVIQEPGEELNPETAATVYRALETAAADRTVIVLATQLPTLKDADHIFLFHDGQLHADGTHAGLVQHCGLYRHLLYLRFNEFRDRSQAHGVRTISAPAERPANSRQIAEGVSKED